MMVKKISPNVCIFESTNPSITFFQKYLFIIDKTLKHFSEVRFNIIMTVQLLNKGGINIHIQ